MEKFKKIVNVYNNFEKKFITVLTIVMVAVIFSQVVTRYVFGNALSWSEEVGRYIFVWISWIGVSTGILEGNHIRVTILPNFLHNKGFFKSESILYIILDLLWIFTSLIVIKFSMDIIVQQKALGVYSAATQTPMWIPYIVLPISSIIVTLRLVGDIVLKILNVIHGKPEERLEVV